MLTLPRVNAVREGQLPSRIHQLADVHSVGTDETFRSDLSSWTREVSESYGGLKVIATGRDTCKGSLKERKLDQLRLVEVFGTPQIFQRTPGLIAKRPVETLTLSLMISGTSRLFQDGRSCVLEPGDFCLLESARPYRFEFLEPTKMLDFVWARPLIRISSEQSMKLTALSLRDATPLSSWLSKALQELLTLQNNLSRSGAIGLAHATAEIVTATALEALPDPVDDDSRRRYDDIVRFIENSLSDQALSLEMIAEKFHVSARTVERTFEKFGTSVAATIRDRRLEACRQMMVSPSCSQQPIGWIISQFGISSPQVFSRMFASRFGMSPSAYRLKYGVPRRR